MKSLICTLLTNKSNVTTELENIKNEYNKTCALQEKCDNKYELIRLEKRRQKLSIRLYILSKKSK